mmetsp:Transcript_7220/g.29440  ORF Transcript_7220/g.29440 Transcript_7220/m.29440 type:complete len:281 (+) Transcript_7220:789-1631(+)
MASSVSSERSGALPRAVVPSGRPHLRTYAHVARARARKRPSSSTRQHAARHLALPLAAALAVVPALRPLAPMVTSAGPAPACQLIAYPHATRPARAVARSSSGAGGAAAATGVATPAVAAMARSHTARRSAASAAPPAVVPASAKPSMRSGSATKCDSSAPCTPSAHQRTILSEQLIEHVRSPRPGLRRVTPTTCGPPISRLSSTPSVSAPAPPPVETGRAPVRPCAAGAAPAARRGTPGLRSLEPLRPASPTFPPQPRTRIPVSSPVSAPWMLASPQGA